MHYSKKRIIRYLNDKVYSCSGYDMIRPARGSVILMIAFFVTSVLNYFFNVALSWLLLPEQYGIIRGFHSFSGYIDLVCNFRLSMGNGKIPFRKIYENG
jgi:hypothetical protein